MASGLGVGARPSEPSREPTVASFLADVFVKTDDSIGALGRRKYI